MYLTQPCDHCKNYDESDQYAAICSYCHVYYGKCAKGHKFFGEQCTKCSTKKNDFLNSYRGSSIPVFPASSYRMPQGKDVAHDCFSFYAVSGEFKAICSCCFAYYGRCSRGHRFFGEQCTTC